MADLIEPDRRDLVKSAELALVLQLRRDGYSVEYIAQKVRVPPVRVNVLLKEALAELQGDSLAVAGEIRELELQRLDVATKALMPSVEAGELDAMDRLLKVQARRAKYLGLDAPAKVEEKHEVTVTVDWMGEARVRQLQGAVIENQPAPAPLPAPADVVDVEARPVGDQQAALDARMAAHEQERYPERSAFPRRPKPKEELTPEQKQAEADRIRAGEAPRK